MIGYKTVVSYDYMVPYVTAIPYYHIVADFHKGVYALVCRDNTVVTYFYPFCYCGPFVYAALSRRLAMVICLKR